MSLPRDRLSSSETIRRSKEVLTRWRFHSEKSKHKVKDGPDSDERSLLNTKERSTRSHDSLVTNSPALRTIDLAAPNVEVKPLHSSVLGQAHCIQVATQEGSKYISCTTAEEMDRWMSSLRRTINPQDEQTRRSDSSLKLWIVEAKNITPKRRYYCDILLDQTLYAKTSIKTMSDMLFWGEHFEFKSLPSVEQITVNLYREADKKKKKEKNMLVGYINLTIADLENRQLTEKWINCQSGTVGKNGKDAKNEVPIIRIKVRRQTVDILPLEYYQPFLKYLTCDYKELCKIFEPLLAVKEKEDFAICLIHILQKQGKACEFLSDIVTEEISRLDDEHLTFRGNSIATKAVEAYMKLVGAKYLHNTLGDLIQQLIQSPDDCEVDPTKVATPQLLNCQQKNLDMYSNMAWVKVINSFCYFPNELREVFSSFRSRCRDRGKADYSDNLISGCIFLRFLCPAILYPSLFNLTQEYPNERASRTLTLIAKTIQTLANFTQFGVKEDYMIFMNAFVEREAPNMKNFLLKISSGETSNQFLEFDGHIDLGKELSVLHVILVECTSKYSQTAGTQLEELTQIITPLNSALEDPTVGKKKIIRKSQIYDNMISIPAQTHDTSQPIFKVASSPAKMGNTTNLPAVEIQIDLSNIRRNFSDNLADSDKTFSNSSVSSQGKITGSTLSLDSKRSTNRTLGMMDVRNVSVVRPTQILDGEKMSLTRMTSPSDDANGDYVDLIPLLDDTSEGSVQKQSNSKTDNQPHQPLAFANPLFRHQQLLKSRKCGFMIADPETHRGIPVSQAQTVQRVSSDSSLGSSEEDENEPWQVKLAKTSSPLGDSSEQYSHLEPFKKLGSFSSNDSFYGQSVSSISNVSFYTCSSDFNISASGEVMSPTSPTSQPYLSGHFDGVMNGFSTFPRRQRVQQEPVENKDSSTSNEAKNTSLENSDSSTPLSHRAPAFHRQISSPSDGSVQKTSKVSVILPSRAKGAIANQSPNFQSWRIHGVKSPSGIVSSAVNIINQRRNMSTGHLSLSSNPDVQTRRYISSKSNTISPTYVSPGMHQQSDGSIHIGSPDSSKNKNSASNNISMNTSGSSHLAGLMQKTPSSIAKSTGWLIAHHLDRPSSLQGSWSSKDASIQNHAHSTPTSISSVHESSSAPSLNSPTSSSNLWDYTPSQTDSDSSISSPTKLQHKNPTNSDSGVSLGGARVSKLSNEVSTKSTRSGSNSSSVSSTPDDLKHTNQLQNKLSKDVVINARLPGHINTGINTVIPDSSPLTQSPSFFPSNYAVVRPHSKNPFERLSSPRAASYHAPAESSKPTRYFPASRSLDLGYLYQTTDESGSSKSTPAQPSSELFPTRSSSKITLNDERTFQADPSVTSNSRLSPQPTVHMGISSVMRKLQEQEKTKQEYEKEIHILRQQLLEAQERLQQTEMRLLDHESETHKLMDEWQNKLVASEEKMRRQQEQKEEYMNSFILRLHQVEDDLQKEHSEMASIVEHKQQVIEVQEHRLHNLDQANRKLLLALADLQGRDATEEGSMPSPTRNGGLDSSNFPDS